MKKYIFRMLICLLAISALFAVNAAAEETNACGDALTWAYADGTLTISGNGPMYDYEEGAAPWAAYKDQITKVVFSGNVTTVGSYAFKDYDAITDVDFGSAMTRTAHGTVYTMAIIGQIEGHTAAPSGTKTTQYEHMLPLLAKLEESREVDGILFLLNTVGGDVEAGLAIAELIAGLTKPTAAIVLGGSHSIGVPLAVAAQRSFAVPSAAMTIHPVRMSGTVIAAPQTYNYFQRLQERIVAFVAGHSRISAEKFQALMLAKDDMAADVGSVIYGEEAVHLGIIDQLGGLREGLDWLYRKMNETRG